jgi:predicted DNA-binding ribbon-helix-helix protein
MSTLSIRLPESVHDKLKEMAIKEGVSMNQLISLAVSEKLSTLMTVDYLKQRAERGNREAYDALLDTIPSVDTDE